MTAVTQTLLHTLLRYNKKTGVLTWRTSPARCVPAGKEAGTIHPQGYRMLFIKGRGYGAHRLIWLLVHGALPQVVDHKNGKRDDNRLCNLRSVTGPENLQAFRKTRKDSTTGYLGVTYRKDCNKYQAKLQRNGVTQHLGTFNTPEKAHAAYKSAKNKMKGA